MEQGRPTGPFRPLISYIMPVNILPCILNTNEGWFRIHEFSTHNNDQDREVHLLMDKWENGRWTTDTRTLDIDDNFVKELAALFFELCLRRHDRTRLCLSFAEYITQHMVPASTQNPEAASNMPHFSMQSSVGTVLRMANDDQEQSRSAWMREWLNIQAPPADPQPPAYEATPSHINHGPDPGTEIN